MDSYTSMRQKLEPLGLYETDGANAVSCELKAYAEGLDTLFATLGELEREFFIPTAQSFGLSARERFSGREREDLTVAERRERLMYSERNVMGDITESGFAEFMDKIGVESYTMEIGVANAEISIVIGDSKTDGEKALIEREIAAEIPAHMTVTINYSE